MRTGRSAAHAGVAAIVGPVAAAIAIVEQDERFLLVRRRNPPDAGLWGFPGGKIEPGETIMQAACRELLEETGVMARACVLLTPFEVIRSDADAGKLAHFVLLPVSCRWVSGTASASSDALAAGWFTIAELSGRGNELSGRVLDLAREARRTTLGPRT